MALPLSVFKSPSEITLPVSVDSDRDLTGTESKRNTIFRHWKKNSKQSHSSIDTQPSQQTIPTDQIQAVRVNPQGFVLSEKRPRFETIMISQNDQIFSVSPSSLSEIMDIGVVGRPLNNDAKPSMCRLSNINYDAQHLFRCCSVNKVDNVAASHNQSDWDHEFGRYELPLALVGPMILARHDKAPLHILHAMAMLDFAENVMSPQFDHYQHQRKVWRTEGTHFEHQKVVMTRRLEIAGMARRKEFEKFWQKFKQQTVDGHPELLVENDETTMQQQMELWMVNREELEPRPGWASVPSPYEITNRTKRLSFGNLS